MTIKAVESPYGVPSCKPREKKQYTPKKPIIETRRELFRETLKKAMEKGN